MMTTTESILKRFADKALAAIPNNPRTQSLVDRIQNLPHDCRAISIDGVACYSIHADDSAETDLVILILNAVAQLDQAGKAELADMVADHLRWNDGNDLRTRLWKMLATDLPE